MSIDATSWAWIVPVRSSAQRLILLSLADRAGEDHKCYPSNKRLAEDTVLNIKTVQKVVNELNLGKISSLNTKTDFPEIKTESPKSQPSSNDGGGKK